MSVTKTNGGVIMAKIQIMIDNLKLFMGLYASVLHDSDTDYYLAESLGGSLGDEVDYDFDEFKNNAGKACVDSLEQELYSHDVITNMDYISIHSPKYYNYDTDALLMEVDYNFIKLVKYCKHTNCEKFNQYLKDNYTSCDGYISFIENNVNDFFLKDWFFSHRNMAVDVMIEFYLTQEIDLDAHMENMYEACQEWLCTNAKLVQAESV